MSLFSAVPRSTLFLSDLDGTLLDRTASLPAEDAVRINRLTAEGVRISFATARTVRSVKTILSAVDFSHPGCAPVALMNGTMIRDMREGKYLAVEKIRPASVRALLAAMDGTGAEPFVYTCDTANPVDGDPLVTYYRRIGNGAMRRFRDERVNKYKKPFRVFGGPEELERGGEVVYFCVIGPEGLIRETAREAEQVPRVSLTAYPDAYEPWVWYLEIFPETASKRHAVEFLRSWTGADFVVAFGDNRNDIPMFEAADFAVAVSSASEEVKAEADAETDSVTEFIERLAGLA